MLLPQILILLAFAQPQPPACQQGAELFRQGNLDGARTLLEPAVRQKPTSFCAKVLGVVYAASGDYRLAEPVFAQACRLDAAEQDACYYWARALYSLDRFEESIKALDRAAGSTTKPWRVPMGRGQALDALGRTEAEADFKKALEQRRRDPDPPTEPDPILSYSAFLYRQGRTADSLNLLRQSPPGYQRIPAYYYQLGRALAQADQWNEAAEALQQAVTLKPVYAEAHGLLSRVYYRLGKAELGAAHATKALQGSVTSR